VGDHDGSGPSLDGGREDLAGGHGDVHDGTARDLAAAVEQSEPGVEREDAQDLGGRAAQVRQVGEVVPGAVERRRRHAGGLEAPGQLGHGQQAPAGCGTEQVGDQELVVDGVQRSAAGPGRSQSVPQEAGPHRAALVQRTSSAKKDCPSSRRASGWPKCVRPSGRCEISTDPTVTRLW
jgi:hypothetical protein